MLISLVTPYPIILLKKLTNQCYENAQENEETPLKAGDEEQGHQEHTQQGQPQVLVKFLPNNLNSLR